MMYNIVARGRQVNIFQAGSLVNANVSTVGDPIKNDVIVPIYSARYPWFTEIMSFVGFSGRNHARATCGRNPECPSDVAPLVLLKIQAAESSQPAQ